MRLQRKTNGDNLFFYYGREKGIKFKQVVFREGWEVKKLLQSNKFGMHFGLTALCNATGKRRPVSKNNLVLIIFLPIDFDNFPGFSGNDLFENSIPLI